ncbi:hypothetical protein ACFOY8_12610 [Thalassospira xianhensis]|uniref:Uncharacterized protein n=1 Tax=Thalassospira xianhensis MCCC 1A02616 TaxID=1177929 RepID=A0A367UDJ3_9PROT|nr:hypothetical protein [Thalassospira xianhensis]RCK06298.1 hypothetical protein TH5_08820 [Thalassospira xianhensis MCCC 1A02616]
MAKAPAQSGKKNTPRTQNVKKTSEAVLDAAGEEEAYVRTMYSLPPRFQVRSDLVAELVNLIDTTTGKEVKVAIGAFGEVKRVLGVLFGGHPEESSTFVPDGKGGTVIPDQDEEVASAPAAKAVAPKKQAASAKQPSPPKKSASSANKATPPKKAASKNAAVLPEGWQAKHDFQGVSFEFAVSSDGANGYDVFCNGQKVAFLKFDPSDGKFWLNHIDTRVESTSHRNVLGAYSRVAVAYSV